MWVGVGMQGKVGLGLSMSGWLMRGTGRVHTGCSWAEGALVRLAPRVDCSTWSVLSTTKPRAVSVDVSPLISPIVSRPAEAPEDSFMQESLHSFH